MAGPLLILGPQRPSPNLNEALSLLPDRPGAGPVVVITAGWRHDEEDAVALLPGLPVEARHLPLYAWFEAIQTAAPGLAEVYQARQARIRALKSLYRRRLHPAVETLRAMIPLQQRDRELVRPELMDAVAELRRLDDRFIARADQIRAAFAEQIALLEPPLVRRRRAEAREALLGAQAILIAGGHVAVLRNRMFFFGLDRSLPEAHEGGAAVIAWSAGAMVAAERVVLFHDDPPEGPSEPEVFDRGIGLFRDLLPLPHARQRLRLEDEDRVAIMAARFAPATCVGLESGAWLERDARGWRSRGAPEAAPRLRRTGLVDALEVLDA